jgi:hypothetical protein
MAKKTNTISSRWNVPRLLVPMDVQALVVSKSALNLSWAWNTLKYTNANEFLDVDPSMFSVGTQPGVDQPGVGITLHWALPDGVTQGQQDKNGAIVYPYIPNRWMVTRIWGGQSRSWIIQSDYLNKSDGLNSFLDPANTQPTPTKIGKVWDLADWPGEAGVTQNHFLRAIGPGTTTFTAYVPGINGVFTFYDDMGDLTNQQATVTYMVMGWYASPEDDPMLGTALFGKDGFQTLDQWNLLMDHMKWTVGNETDIEQAINTWKEWAATHGIPIDPNKVRDILPSQTLCQGMVYNVNWLGINGATQSGVPKYIKGTPENELPMIAIGNTSIDALAALMKYELDLNGGTDGAKAAEFLQAFQYHQLSTYDSQEGEDKLYNEIFKAWFGSQDGYTIWLVRDPVNPDPPVISDELQKDLDTLNSQEKDLSISSKLLQEAQIYLYGLWWKQGKSAVYPPNRYPPGITKAEWKVINENIQKAMGPAQDDVSSYQAQVDALAESNDKLVKKIKAELPKPLVLDENTGGRYWHANDPVFLIYGAKRSYRHGEDGRFSDDEKLFTRFTGQTVTGILVQIPDHTPPEVNSSNITIPIVPNPNNYFPPETSDLCIETFFFDTGNAEAIAKEAAVLLNIPFQNSYTEIVKTQQTSVWNSIYNINIQVLADVSGIVGMVPSKVAVDPWMPPWAPLYLAWEIKWYPSYNKPVDAMEKWKYDETSYEYQWREEYDPASGTPVILSGYTLLTPKGAFAMEAELEEYLNKSGDQPALREFLETVGDWDFLSQSLSGLSNRLLGLSTTQLNIPTGTISDLVKNETQLTPIPDQESKYFFPVRAGHFQINKLWVVDDFGQVFDPISARGQVPENYSPAIGQGLITEQFPKLIQLPPRITQPTKMDFQFLTGHSSGSFTMDPNTSINPICGWLLPNHLDKGLMLYSTEGTLLAEILLTGTTGELLLRLDYAPGKNTPVGTPLSEVIINNYLRGFVEGLFAQPDPAKAFIALLSVIDETLWTINPLGGRNNELTAVLIGRPLALIRAGLDYQLSGGAQYDEQWKLSGLKDSGDYENISLPVQLGNTKDPQDGTIGYFLGTDFSVFSSLIPPQTDSAGYIANNRVPLKPNSGIQDVTMIIDPRGSLSAISGILPLSQLVLPAVFIEAPLNDMEVTFRTGPLIVEPDQLRMPLPTEINGKWSWIQHSGVTTWETMTKIEQANQQARFSTSVSLRDGWLQLGDLFKPLNKS